MLRKNLIAIAIATIGLVFTNNAFGQWHPELDKIKSPRVIKSTKAKSKRTAKPVKTEMEIEGLKGTKQSNRKRKNLGDTATHERRRRVRN